MNKINNIKPLRVGGLGFGGLGQAAARVLAVKKEMIQVAAADAAGYLYQPEGIDPDLAIRTYQQKGSVDYLGELSQNSIALVIASNYSFSKI